MFCNNNIENVDDNFNRDLNDLSFNRLYNIVYW